MLARIEIVTGLDMRWLVFLPPHQAWPDEHCKLIVHHNWNSPFQSWRGLILIRRDYDEALRDFAQEALAYVQRCLSEEHATAPPSLLRHAELMQQFATELSRAIGKTGGVKAPGFKNPPSELALLTLLMNAIKLRDAARPLTDRRLSPGSQAIKDRSQLRKTECIALARQVLAKEPALQGNKSKIAERIIAIANKNPDSSLRTDRHAILGTDTIRRYLKKAMDAGELPTNGKLKAH